ncbi:CHAT domain-containing tetratricopeptide repeat protein [Phormidesmis priestleyi]
MSNQSGAETARAYNRCPNISQLLQKGLPPSSIDPGQIVRRDQQADQLSSEANKLYQQNTVTSINQAIQQWKQAAQLYQQAASLYQESFHYQNQAKSIKNIAIAYNRLGNKQKSLNYYNQAWLLFYRLGVGSELSEILLALGLIHNDLGEYQSTLECYEQALKLSQKWNNFSTQITALNNLGTLYSQLGNSEKALHFINQALPLIQQEIDIHKQSFNKIEQNVDWYIEKYYSQIPADMIRPGAIQFYRNQWQQKLEELYSLKSSVLTVIGHVYSEEGSQASLSIGLDNYTKALSLAQAGRDSKLEAAILNNIGLIYTSQEALEKALESYRRVLLIRRRIMDHRGEAITLQNIGTVYAIKQQKLKALEFFEEALELAKAEGDQKTQISILGNAAVVYRRQGNFQKSLNSINAAVEIVEKLRQNIRDDDLQTSYFSSAQDYYQLKIDLLMQLHQQQPQKGYDALALEVSERSRARTLNDLLTEARADIYKDIDPDLRQQEKDLQQRMDAREEERVRLSDNPATSFQAANLKEEIETLEDQRKQLRNEIRNKSPAYANLKYPEPLKFSEIQQQLDPDTVLLQYSLGEERSYLWVVSKTAITSHTLPKRSKIEQAAGSFYSAVTDAKGSLNDPKETGQWLSKAIKLDDIMPQLQGKKLLIAADGILHKIPFAALPNPKSPDRYQPLILEHEIVNLPSISAIAALRQTPNKSPAPKMLAVVADPVFSKTDERVGKESSNPCASVPFLASSDPNRASDSPLDLQLQASILERATRNLGLRGGRWDRLPNTRREAERILALIPQGQRTAVCDFDANREWVMQQAPLDQYRYVLFATHGSINTAKPEESSIVLSLVDQKGEPRSGLLRLGDIFNLNLNAELVVLSACQTGLGKEVRGEGLIGLTRGLMYAGSKRVVVSLWNVNDSKTADLMERFYQQVILDKHSPATALQTAQKQMWQTQQGTEFQHPYYWAAFTLQGEWRP